jgi:hypothetical protein
MELQNFFLCTGNVRRLGRILRHLEKLEIEYRIARSKDPHSMRTDGSPNESLRYAEKEREAVFACFRRIDFTDAQISIVIRSAEDLLLRMEAADETVRALIPKGNCDPDSIREARTALRELERQYLTNSGELRTILALICKSGAEILDFRE